MFLPLFGIIWMAVFNPSSLSFTTLLFYMFLGDSSYIVLVVVFLYLYLTAKVMLPPLKFLILKEKIGIKSAFSEIKNLLKHKIYFLLTVSFAGFFLNLSLNNLSEKSTSEKIASSSSLLAGYDYMIFNRDFLFWLNDLVNQAGGAVLSKILITSYELLNVIFAVFMIILLLGNKTLAKKFIFFFFIIQFISLPVWYFLPALEPISMYISNAMKIGQPERIALQIENYRPASALDFYQKKTVDHNKKYGDYLALTAFPSMHAGWGVGFVLYSFMFYRPAILFFLPWFLLEITGAVYVGQHYAVDMLFGIVMAIAAYFLVELIFFAEKKYYKGKGSLFIIDIAQEDFRKFLAFFKKEIWKSGK